VNWDKKFFCKYCGEELLQWNQMFCNDVCRDAWREMPLTAEEREIQIKKESKRIKRQINRGRNK